MGQINHAGAVERSPVIDAHHGRFAVGHVGDQHLGAKRQGAVGCRKGAGAKHFTAGCAISVKTGAIPTGLALEGADHLGCGNGHRGNGQFRGLLLQEVILAGGASGIADRDFGAEN